MKGKILSKFILQNLFKICKKKDVLCNTSFLLFFLNPVRDKGYRQTKGGSREEQ